RVVERTAREEPDRNASQIALAPGDEVARVLVPPVGVERSADDHGVEPVRYERSLRREEIHLEPFVLEGFGDDAGDSFRTAALAAPSDEYAHAFPQCKTR